jgi:endonuclease/exonuclease/phosphatase (EEP) superfamily protein YafD
VALAVSIVLVAVLWGVSERTWWGTVFVFVPRHPLLIAPVLLLICALFTDRRSIAINGANLCLVAGPLMGGRLPLAHWLVSPATLNTLKVVSCNVQLYRPNFADVLREIQQLEPDVVALQEAVSEEADMPEDKLCSRQFQGWYFLHESEFWIGSRFPIHRVAKCVSKSFQHETALTVQVDAPQGAFVLNNVHLTTPRYGLLELTSASIRDGLGPARLEEYTRKRGIEAIETRDYVSRHSDKLPTLVVGDFNTPTSSNLYRAAWNRFTNAFDAAGFGFGYTAPLSKHRHGFDYVPWVRIDHILADPSWSVTQCKVGRGHGSDHHLIWAVLSR